MSEAAEAIVTVDTEPETVEDAPARTYELSEVNPRTPMRTAPLDLLRTLRTHRHLAANFISRDVRLKYRDSALGYFWSLLEPLMLTGVYYVLYVILAGRTDHTYVVWIILGVIVWQFFTKTLNNVLSCLTKNEGMIKQVYFPRELFALTTVGSELTFATLSLLVAIPMMLYFGIKPSVYLVMVPAGLVLAGVLALGVGLMLACLNVVNRDIEHLVRFLTRVTMFVSPVMWTIDMVPKSRVVMLKYTMYNPITMPITLVRNGVAGKGLGMGVWPVVVCLGVTFCAFVFGAMIFRRYEGEVVKKL